jgi:hypothetical protein
MIAVKTGSRSAGGKVPAEFIGRARCLRDAVGRTAAEADRLTKLLIGPLRPRHGFRQAPRRTLPDVATAWRVLLPEAGRLGDPIGEFADRKLRLAELRAYPIRMRFAAWDGADELAPALRMTLVVCAPPRFRCENMLLADVGLHALARRYERGADRSDAAVLRDLVPLARSAATVNGEFAIPTADNGCWIGRVTRVRGASVLAVRTFVIATGNGR